MRRTLLSLLITFNLVSCSTSNPTPTAVVTQPSKTATSFQPQQITSTFTLEVNTTLTPTSLVPPFEHTVLILFENKEFGTVIGNPNMPQFNRLAQEYTLLTQFYAVRHPSLPNYIALIGGETFGISSDCNDCFVNAPSLPDLIEASGRNWKTYQEDMPQPCFLGDTHIYAQKRV